MNSENCQDSDVKTVIANAINDLWKTIHSDAKSSHQTEPRIRTIDTVSVPMTKAGKPEEESSYIVNFEGDEGFAVVTMEGDNCPCVLALTESGTLDKNKLFNKRAVFDFDEEAIVYRYIERMLLGVKCNNQRADDSRDNTRDRYVWYTDTIAHPIIHVKWGQEYPFNMHMPFAPSTATDHGLTSVYRGRYSVGCTIIAAMQMAVATEHPYSFTYNNNQTIDSYMFSSVSFYGNYSQYNPDTYDSSVSDSMKGITEILAQLLYDFGYMAGANYTESGSTTLSVLAAMNYLDNLDHNRYGAFDVVSNPSALFYNKYVIINMINAGKPLLVQGTALNFYLQYVTHAWVIDGYLRLYRIGLDDDKYTRTLVHFNWGWHGLYDGYYYNTDIGDRYSIDESYDPDTTPTSWYDDDYNMDVYFYTY